MYPIDKFNPGFGQNLDNVANCLAFTSMIIMKKRNIRNTIRLQIEWCEAIEMLSISNSPVGTIVLKFEKTKLEKLKSSVDSTECYCTLVPLITFLPICVRSLHEIQF